MGNYYEGKLLFILKKDTPKELIHDLKRLEYPCERDSLVFIKNTSWGLHERFNSPIYDLYEDKSCIELSVHVCTKGYNLYGNKLGDSIYDVLYPYIDTSYYDMSDGGYIGEITDENDTYYKEFYIDYSIYNKTVEDRKYICNPDCSMYAKERLCPKYEFCKRAYDLGRRSANEEER